LLSKRWGTNRRGNCGGIYLFDWDLAHRAKAGTQ